MPVEPPTRELERRQQPARRDDIEKIKTRGIVRAVSELAEMKQRNPDEYARLAPKLRDILEVDPDKSH
jgi:hypothetical protein